MKFRASAAARMAAFTVIGLCVAQSALAQLNEHCTISILNRTVRVNPDGSWELPNVPAGFGPVKARVTCVENGVTRSGESDFFTITPNKVNAIPPITLGVTTPIPASVVLTPASPLLSSVGQTLDLTATAIYPDASTRNVTASSAGTSYISSNPAVATVSPEGLVTAVTSGAVMVQAANDGASGILMVRVVFSSTDTDGDGIPDADELRLGLNPNDPTDAVQDVDRDGLTNLQEYQLGTDLRNADTDGDGLPDGREVALGTNALLVDTDGDGVRDGLEVATGSDPLNPSSVNLAQALSRIEAAPDNFTIVVNSVIGIAYTQLRITGFLQDGTTLDLMSSLRGTNYSSSDLNLCNFGQPDGRVFGGQPGPCSITITNSGFQAVVSGSVSSFTPISLSSIAIPGYANNVDVNGNRAYVAAGSAGLQVVDVSNPDAPVIVGSVDTPGNANDVRVVQNLVYVADGAAGLSIIDVTNPQAPTIIGNLDTGGEANDVVVVGSLAYVADGPAGLQVISVANPRAPLLVRTVDTPGTARGVSVQGGIAVVADDVPQPGLRVIDVSNPSAAQIIGSVVLDGQPTDVDMVGSFAYVADYTGGVRVVNVGVPTAPVVVGGLPGSAPTGFVPRDVQVAGQFAIFAEQLFANAVAPIVDISDPTTPRFRGMVDFGQDYAGTGIAVSGPFVYWTGQSFVVSSENGTNGTTRLFIGQYISRDDLAGVPPTVVIDSPADGGQVLEGSAVTVHVTAADDVAVSSVSFLVNGIPVFTDTSQPFEYTLTVPTGITTLVLGARAVDFGNNVATASTTTLSVVPDPLTTVTGRVVTVDGIPVAGATITVLDRSSSSGPDGSFSIPGVPTARGNIVVTASFLQGTQQLTGASAPQPPVPSGTTDVGTVTMVGANFETNYGTFLTNCDDCFFTFTLPFTFPFYGRNYTTAHVGTNGYITFEFGDYTYTESLPAFANQPRISAFFDDLYGGRGSGGVYLNSQLPGRFVVTHLNVPHYSFGGSNTLQITLYEDGRILFAYRSLTSTTTGAITGLTPGPNSPLDQVDFSQTRDFVVPAGASVLEYFTATNPFDLANKAVLFTPLPDGGYSVHTFELTLP